MRPVSRRGAIRAALARQFTTRSVNSCARRAQFIQKRRPRNLPQAAISARLAPGEQAPRRLRRGCGPDSAPRGARAEPGPKKEWCIQNESTPEWGPRNFAFGEYPRALRLTSELVDLRAGMRTGFRSARSAGGAGSDEGWRLQTEKAQPQGLCSVWRRHPESDRG